jgi:hypothetical protein
VSNRGANSKFKVGDKVRILDKAGNVDDVFFMRNEEGFEVGTVHEISGVTNSIYWAKGYFLKDHDHSVIWTDGMLELVELEEGFDDDDEDNTDEKEIVKMHKYKFGDKVKVRSDLKVGNYDSHDEAGLYCNLDMLDFSGKTLTILSASDDFGDYVVEENGWLWCDAMFEGLATEEDNLEEDEFDDLDDFLWLDVDYNKEASKPVSTKQKGEAVDMTGYTYQMTLNLQRVIYNDPATIIFYNFSTDPEGTVRKAIAKCLPTDRYNKDKGLEVAVLKAFRREIQNALRKQ